MKTGLGRVSLAGLLVFLPTLAFGQASVVGTVRDTSGAVLPGVTAEASSPSMIERVRTTQTDGTGQYPIVEQRPGSDTLTFTLSSFGTVKREGIELSGTFVATINAEMHVGVNLWLQPQTILIARFARISVQFDF